MHELSLCKNILEIVNQKLHEIECKRVKKIYLEIGELIAVEKSTLIFSFDIAAKETLAKNAILEIISVSGEAICDVCHKNVSIHNYSEACQYCGNFRLTITRGEEFYVKSMEVE